MHEMNTIDLTQYEPDLLLDVEQTFGFPSHMKIPGFSQKHELVPQIDASYKFDKTTTLAILAGFCFNRRVMIQGYHGTGKSTHIEQVAARLNWPCLRINLDSHITRVDLMGRDVITLKDGQQITAFRDGFLPWSVQRSCALVFDEYDAGRADVMFVLQRVLEVDGKLTLPEQNRIIHPNPYFRLFATANTIGLGDHSGIYHGTQPINQGQMDRWHIVTTLNYLDEETEINILLAKFQDKKSQAIKHIVNIDVFKAMVNMANLTRQGFIAGDISTVMSPRTVMSWVENACIFDDIRFGFEVSFLNRSDPFEHNILNEYYQRCFGDEQA